MEPNWLNNSYAETLNRLLQLVAVPSFSKEEQNVVALFESWMLEDGISFHREGNNIWTRQTVDETIKPTVLLNSHTDTVKPNSGYTRNPFDAVIQSGKLFGLGSNDAAGALMCLYAVFKQIIHEKDLPFNLVFAATAEDEISGTNGIESIIAKLGKIDFAIVGEPTQMQMAVAEKGLLVIDCITYGKSGHAAQQEGDNAIYRALKDIEWFQSYKFPEMSETLGAIQMNVTIINAYDHETLLKIIKQQVSCEITPRSLRLKPSRIPITHPIVQAGLKLGLQTYGSPTSSDQALIPFTSIKIGPGDSARSHQADEFIFLHELKEGIQLYHRLLTTIQL
jgi:acetylornithine deacetylase